MEPFRYNDLEALSTALPTDIESRKEFGDFDGEARLIEQWLQKDISENLKAKLRVEREILKRLPSDYPYSFEEAYEKAKTVIKDLTPEQFRELQDKGRIDWIYVNGKEHFIHSTTGTLRNDVEHAARKEKGGALRTEAPESAPGNTFWQSLIDMKKNGSDSWRFRIRFTLRVDDDAFRPGKIKVYIPVVCACSYVSDIKILETSSDHYILADENAPQRTICYEEDIKENHDFFVEYEYTVKSVYHDLWTEEAVAANRAEMNKPYPEEEVKPEDADKFMIEIDPGISFGTGKHETTQLCIKQLIKYIEGAKEVPTVLDVGCGSGILSIVALKLGAKEVVGTDLDADCMISTRDNMQVNHLDEKLGTFYVGNLIDDTELQKKVGTEEYDIVVANILADVIIPMAPVIPDRLKEGGYFITSGIIDFKENEVKEAIEAAGLKVVEINHQGEWVNITAQKQAK